MSQRTNTYNYLYLEYGDKWYPLFDKQNMLTSENQLQALFKFVGPGILSGWEVYKLSDYRTNQLSLIDAYLAVPVRFFPSLKGMCSPSLF